MIDYLILKLETYPQAAGTRPLAAAPVGSVWSIERGKLTGIKFPPTASSSRFHANCDGQAASEGRRRRKFVLAHGRRGKTGRSATDPIALKNARLFITGSRFPP
jgi:hypothetical protein